ncbi:MAG: hypothetical protein M3040_17615 [Bacteroidota bacterium]|nr:hypothetical protein [Bacteroidota bacterium]
MNFFSFLLIVVAMTACSRKMSTETSSAGAVDSLAHVVAASIPGIEAPTCILQKIDSIKKQPVWNPPAEIYEYEYDGNKVYAISSNCCDFFNAVVDANCKYICAPSGGFTGRGDGKCVDFFKVAKQLRLVWKDERKRQ